ncbi:MAG TPA: hypothetical protein VGI89_04455 [Rhizomicrobium sp.]
MIVRILAIILTGLALVAPMAHLYELPRKIGLSKERYFVVQEIYQGWVLAGFLLPLALITDLALAFASRDGARLLAAIAAGLIAINLIIFMIWTQPVNRVTNNWTVQTENWQALRQQWEYSHAVNAGVTLAAFIAITIAALKSAGD